MIVAGSRGDALRTTVTLVAAGLPGLLVLLLQPPPAPAVPPAAMLVGPALMLAAASFAGALLARWTGLRSLLAGGGWRSAQSSLGRSAGIGLALGIIVAGLDHETAAVWQPAPRSPPSLIEGWSPAALAIGLLYGGVVEEIIMRWGLLSAIAAGMGFVLRQRVTDSGTVAAPAVFFAAAVFAAGHLPVLFAAGMEVTDALLLRTLGLNLALGLVFGWIFVRQSLEAAMVAHGGFHAGVAGLAMSVGMVA